MADVTHIYGNEIVDAAARQDIADLETTTNNLKDDFHAYHSELGAGYADQIVSGIQNTDQTPYNFRAVLYDATLEKVEGIVGVDVVVNQLVSALEQENWAVENGATASFSNGVVTLSSTIQNNGIRDKIGSYSAFASHKYFMHMEAKGTAGQVVKLHTAEGYVSQQITISASDTWESANSIIKPTNNGNGNTYIYGIGGAYSDISVRNCMCFDLTQTFGSQIADYVYGLETATAGSGVAWLKANFPKIFNAGYVPYNAGTLVHVSGLSAKKTVGFNQFDKDTMTDNGHYIQDADGIPGSNTGAKCTDFIPVIGGATYHINTEQVSSAWGAWYDADKNYISGCIAYYKDGPGRNQIAPSNAKYVRLTMVYPNNQGNVDTFCINLSDPAKNDTYEPYTMHEYSLDSTIDLHGILKLDANNQLYADGDVYPPSGQVNHRYGVMDLGTLNWNYVSSAEYFGAMLPSDAKYKRESAPTIVANWICSKYQTVSQTLWNTYPSCICQLQTDASSRSLLIKDPDYTDATAFKASLSGVLLVYELDTPNTEQAEPYNPDQICDPNGTEEYVSTTVAPVGHVTKYPLDIAGRLDNILSMPTANGTYELRATVSNGKVTYSWVSA